ncbi:MAG: hypothetical protein HUK15_06715, partial [Bacteroidales bacterium]|nr:hypothetical protein [Bacteroidales bacterium]
IRPANVTLTVDIDTIDADFRHDFYELGQKAKGETAIQLLLTSSTQKMTEVTVVSRKYKIEVYDLLYTRFIEKYQPYVIKNIRTFVRL